METDARESNTNDRRVTEWEVREGDEVWVEGTLSRDQGKRQGYRHDKTGWVMRSDVEPTIVRASSYGRGEIDIAYFIASLILLSGAVAMLMIRKHPWIGALPWFRRKR